MAHKPEAGIQLQSPDGERAISISTWVLNGEAIRSHFEMATSSKRIQLASFAKMPGYKWELVSEQHSETRLESTIELDNFAQNQSYRIACKIIAASPILINAVFHDYYCLVYLESKDFFAPIIESFQRLGPAA